MNAALLELASLTPKRHAQYTYAEFLGRLRLDSCRWLDVGCGHGVVPDWTGQQGGFSPTIGVDPDLSSVARNRTARWRVCGIGEAIPVADASIDLVTANMVLEHVADPLALFTEVSRVLRPGGCCVFLTPDAGAYTSRLARLLPESLKAPLARILHNRHEADVYPALYRANDVSTLRELGTAVGLAITVRPISTGPQLDAVPILRTLEAWYMRWRSPRPVLLAVGVRE